MTGEDEVEQVAEVPPVGQKPRRFKAVIDKIGHWSSENWHHILGALGIPLGIALAIIPIYADGKHTAEEKLQILTFIVSFSILFMTLYIFAQFFMILNISGKRSASRGNAKNLEDTLERLEQSSAVISRAFASLEEGRTRMDGALALLTDRLLRSRRKADDEEQISSELYAILKEYLKDVCKAATVVIAARKGFRDDEFSANIKFIYGDHDLPLYKVFVRSNEYDDYRKKLDEELEAKDNTNIVSKNYYYYKIMEEKTYARPFYIVEDLEETLKTIRAENEKGMIPSYAQPSHFFRQVYASCIVVPIKGPSFSQPKYSPHPRKRSSLSINNNERVLGFLCIDSKRIDEFDYSFDLNVMKQLSSSAYNAVNYIDTIMKYVHSIGQGRTSKVTADLGGA
jgi:hypothetical protein